MSNAYISTYTGKYIDVLNMKPSDVCIDDIARSLSLQCRYGGHLACFYSVAQHSILASEITEVFPLEVLMHDATETYISDVPRGIKRKLELDGIDLYAYEGDIAEVIRAAFGLKDVNYHTADEIMLSWEIRDLMHQKQRDTMNNNIAYHEHLNIDKLNLSKIKSWNWQKAEHKFLKRFKEMT